LIYIKTARERTNLPQCRIYTHRTDEELLLELLPVKSNVAYLTAPKIFSAIGVIVQPTAAALLATKQGSSLGSSRKYPMWY
jgi:hypothetical protein